MIRTFLGRFRRQPTAQPPTQVSNPALSGGMQPAQARPIGHPIVVNPTAEEHLVNAAARIGHIERYIAQCAEAGIEIAADKLEHFQNEMTVLRAQLRIAGIKVD